MGKYGPRMYWIDKTAKDLKGHLGHTVQLTGKITDVEKSEMEIKTGESGAGTVIEIEGPGKDVVTSAKQRRRQPGGASQQGRHQDHAAQAAHRRAEDAVVDLLNDDSVDPQEPGPCRPGS